MIKLTNTPNMTGVLISGNVEDFEALYDALHTVVGPEELAFALTGARLRVLGLCYDLRHACMGNRNVAFQEHGITMEQMKYLSMIGPTQNLYVSFETYWPELLYISFVLNEFIESYERNQKKPIHTWDESRAIVRLFQSKVLKLAQATMPEKSFVTFKKSTDGTSLFSYRFYANMYTQFVDYLNLQWIAMNLEDRPKKLHLIAKRLNQHSSEYEKFERQMNTAALAESVLPAELRYGDYESIEIVW